MTGLVPLAAVAQTFGLDPEYVRKIAADQGRPANARRYPPTTHERFPIFIKDGNSRGWYVPAAQWNAHLRIRGRQWNQSV